MTLAQHEAVPYPRDLQSATYSQGGMVCSTSPYAASIGARVLADGGGAVDAAIAVAAAEGVAVAVMCGIGGDAAALFYDASRGEALAFDATALAPRAAGGSPETAGVGVPGEVAMWGALHERAGTRPWAELLAPAVAIADAGVPVPPKLGNLLLRDAERIERSPGLASMFRDDQGAVRRARALRLPALARTLGRIAATGPAELYRGELAHAFVADLRLLGVPIDGADLAAQGARVAAPLSGRYRAFRVLETPPPSAGHRLLEILAVLAHFDVASLAAGSAELLHLIAEVVKTVEADGSTDIAARSRPEVAAARARSIDRARAALRPPAAAPLSAHTSAFVVADRAGDLVSYVHSLGNTFGSGLVAPSTGILLNNILAHESAGPTPVRGARPSRASNCWMVLDDDGPVVLGGTLGGNFQVQGSAQLLVGLLDLGLEPAAAMETLRLHVTTDAAGTRTLVRPEPGTSPDVVAELRARGHELAGPSHGFTHGLFQIIVLGKDRIKIGVSDVRGDGHPMICP